MADKTDIQDKLRKFFSIQGKVKIRTSGVVDVEGNVRLTSLWPKMPVQFGIVTGFFLCSDKNLTTLAGCPQHVGDNFDCSSNMLTSLEFAPVTVGKGFRCSNNQLTSLEHAPSYVPGTFNCANNLLIDLQHAPHSVRLDMSCYGNPLTSLEGAPEQVVRTWWITYDAQLPLLRTLSAQEIQFFNMTEKSQQVAAILNKYMGQGKAGAIRAAAELAKAGFKGNAKW